MISLCFLVPPIDTFNQNHYYHYNLQSRPQAGNVESLNLGYIMLSFTKNLPNPSTLKPYLKPYTFVFSFDQITPGVDNVRYDVCLSPKFCKSAAQLIYLLIVEQTKAGTIISIDTRAISNAADEFRKHCSDILHDGIHKAKAGRQVQIDYLAQIAVAKLLIKEINAQFELLIDRIKNVLWKNEAARGVGHTTTLELRQELTGIQHSRKVILRQVGNRVFKILGAIQQKDLQKLREANFGAKALLPLSATSNPMLYTADTSEDNFIIEEYELLLGHRFEDPNKYDSLLAQLQDFLASIFSASETGDSLPFDMESLLKQPQNIDFIFNYFHSAARAQRLKDQSAPKQKIAHLQLMAEEQKNILNPAFKQFTKTGLIPIISAFYEMKPIYRQYCPPLNPQQIVQFLTTPKARKSIIQQLNRLKEFYGRELSLKPLYDLSKDIEKIKIKARQKLFIRFLKGFCRYHRDFQSSLLLKDKMDKINLTTEEKIINLSRTNKTLYDFLLADEQVVEESTITNHVIVKADVRGSTDITHQMRIRGLNSASYFSLNFFDPISEILPEYSASKAFIEGDAIILSIFEQSQKPGEWYSVARACGIAIHILYILRRYNTQSRANRLPILEVGIGINYQEGAPTFLFDEEKRIMISPAINLADRMSSCSKSIRQRLDRNANPFNLYVFQSIAEEQNRSTSDDLFVRYNVNGIELNQAGFEKLQAEIELKPMQCEIPEIQARKVKIYTGKFPTAGGKYQRLILREALIPQISADDFTVIGPTGHKYYEVCTHPKLYEYVKRMI